MPPILPDILPGAETPLTEQIASFYQSVIRDGGLRAGDRLPTIRAVAQHAGVTRTTVQQAYRKLAESGLVVATVGRGTIVSSQASEPDSRGPVGRFALDTWRHLRDARDTTQTGDPSVADFAELRPDPALFPIDEFRDSLERQLRERGPALLAYGDPSGSRALREYLATCPDTADATTDADQILITSGAQQGIDLVFRSLTSPGTAVAAPIPTYHQLFGTLKALGLRVAPVQCDANGIDLEDLRRVLQRTDVRLLYVMPTFHNPTGRTLDEEQRRAIIEIATEAEVPIVEDEFECELRFAGHPLPSLRSLDSRGWTVTVRSFSKGLFPGVRVGWVHAGRALLGPLTAMKRFADLGTSPLMQAGLNDFIERGGMTRHLEAVRRELRNRHDAAQAALEEWMPEGYSWTTPSGGFALWIETPQGVDPDRLARDAAERGVLVTPGSVFDPLERDVRGIRLSLSRVTTDQVRAGIRCIADCAIELERSAELSKPPLFL